MSKLSPHALFVHIRFAWRLGTFIKGEMVLMSLGAFECVWLINTVGVEHIQRLRASFNTISCHWQ